MEPGTREKEEEDPEAANYSYRLKQQTRLQEDGGSIGNALTGKVADGDVLVEGRVTLPGRRHFVHLSLSCVLSLAIFGGLLQSWELCLVLGLASILSLAIFFGFWNLSIY